MRKIVSVAIVLAALWGSAQAETIFSYRGRMLIPESGSGVAGVRRLHFMVSGTAPGPGQCEHDFKIIAIWDGNLSLKKALALGYTKSASKIRVCQDAANGRYSETFFVNLAYRAGGNVQAGYSWQSSDQQPDKGADTVKSFANIEYHVSGTALPGHLTATTQIK